MTKSELIDRLAAQFPQLVAKDAELAVKMILDAMAESLAKGERIEIRGFGSFGLNYRPPRTGRNPKSGEKVQVPEKYVPHFKAGKELRERVDFNEASRRRRARRHRRGRRAASQAGRPFRRRRPAGAFADDSRCDAIVWMSRVVFVALLFLSLQNAEPVTLTFYHWSRAGRRRSSSSCSSRSRPAWRSGLLAGALRVGAAQAAAETGCAAQRRELPARAPRRAPAPAAPAPAHVRPCRPADARCATRASRWNSSSGGCCRFRRCSSRWAGSPRASTSSTCCRESRALPLSYFRGLNFLLNEQPDKAIESFIEVVKVDPQTIDLHFALGSLFRRQGEIDRAIRMHQNLLDRPDLPADQRRGRDVRARAGLLNARGCSTAPRSCSRSSTARRSSTRRWRFLLVDLRAGEGLAEGDRVDAADGGGAPSSRTTRRSRTTTASSRRPALLRADFDGRAARDRARARRVTAPARARRCCAGDLGSRSRAARGGDRGVEADRVAEPGASSRSSPSAWRRATRRLGDAAQGSGCCARCQAQLPVARPPQRAVHADRSQHEGAGGGRDADRATSSRRNPTLLGLDRLLEAQLAARAGRAPPRPRAGQEPGRASTPSASACTSASSCGFRARQYYWRCPACRQVGDLLAAAHREPEGHA